MNDTILLIGLIAGTACLSALLTWYLQQPRIKSLKALQEENSKREKEIRDQLSNELTLRETELRNLRQERESLLLEKARFESQMEYQERRYQEHQKEVNSLQESFRERFDLLAQKIFEEKSNRFTTLNKENLTTILKPLQERIQQFERRVEDTNKESLERHTELKTQLVYLKDLNQQITREASNLTKALKGDSKMQGNWGELVLERVLEKSGLEKDSEYFVQQSMMNEDNKRVQPDVIIHLPDNKKMIIDAKVSLVAYERYVNEEDETLKPALLREHLQSVKKHVDQLSDKNYQSLYQMESPDFVLMFIPVEPAFALALKSENQLYNDAFEKNIVIVTPSTLLATLRTIDSMWQNEKQHRNAIDIAVQAGRLYDQFKGLLDELEKLGSQLNTVQSTYERTRLKLTGKGNLVTRVEKLKKLGAKASKQLGAQWTEDEGDQEDSLE